VKNIDKIINWYIKNFFLIFILKMEFLVSCAKRLENESYEAVLLDMRKKYKTVRCMRVKTGIVRKLYDGKDSEEFELQLQKIIDEHNTEIQEWIRYVTNREVGKGPWYGIKYIENPKHIEVYKQLKKLPRRMPENVFKLSISNNELKECKKLSKNIKLVSNYKKIIVNGEKILSHCRFVIDNPLQFTMYELGLSIIFLTGRRTCEIMNGKSTFLNGDTEFQSLFHGQAKKRTNNSSYAVPILHNFDSIQKAFERLRLLQKKIPDTNEQVSSKYSSGLRQFLLASDTFKETKKVHNLRKIYACLCLKLFDWKDTTDLYISMYILGHNDIEEPIVYNVVDVGDLSTINRLGKGPFIPEPNLL